MLCLKKCNVLFICVILFNLISCQSGSRTENKKEVKVYYNGFPVPDEYKSGWEKFAHFFQKDTNYVNDNRVTLVSPQAYKFYQPSSTLPSRSKMIVREDLEVHFYPLNLDTAQQYQYVHEYNCKYEPHNFRYADVAYPSPCENGPHAKEKARAVLINKSETVKTIRCRMFFQNTSYWFPTSPDANFNTNVHLQNFYGGSNLLEVELQPGEEKEVFLEYIIGQDPKGNERASKQFYGPARPGSYEFMLWVSEEEADPLVQEKIDYTTINPFAYFQSKWVKGDVSVVDKVAHLAATHFKFVTHLETFDGANIYKPGTVYLLSNRDEKPLCDTCNGYFKDVIADEWTPDDYFKGYIHDAPMIKAEYGNRKENVRIDENGIYLRCPGSTPEKKQKTWGEIKFGPSFLYGTVKVVAKFSQLRNKETHTPTGIVHNLWLYQFNHPYADPIPGHPYAHMVNSRGKQPYEIDIEIWSKIYEENWGGGSAINYSIVDYMRDANVLVKPGEEKVIDNILKVDRVNDRQLNYPGEELLHQDFFNQYHLYEIIWTPHDVSYRVDGEQVAKIDWRMAKIPDEYTFLWIGSPIYQDGTYYAQEGIPFLPNDRFSHIRYISIE
ncbi:family 16 glycosylhydrolase [Aureispira anguillae]|uniref:Family 16 glycosylhydrolase n=1 Tax=Aureispira anguillae TaxID=2864201 RepID=A0A915YJC1_9BACT|nr:family 16 glycosylhydrolase [Aureispira anguillae]BDS14130.1 family 16 glycosylhydrolase [Aureispira anguillae]